MRKLIKLGKKLFPINRSLTGKGSLKTLKIIRSEIPNLKIKKFKSGKKVYDWKIPSEWNAYDAYVKDKRGRKIIDFKKNNLHLVGYSKPIKKKINKQELFKHLHTLEKLPKAIPYVTSYYNKYWGFCSTHNQKKLINKNYRIKDKFEILAGQRRYLAFKKILNKDNPGKGFDKIPCHIREPPEDETDAKAISLGEGLTQVPFTLTDAQNACNELFKVHNDVKIVAKKTGISRMLVERFVKFKRLPKLVQENLTSIFRNPKTATLLAVEASDALTGGEDDPDPEKILALAKKLGEKKKKSKDDYKKMKQAAEENPTETIEKIEDISLKIMNPKEYKITLVAKTADKLDKAAEEHGREPEDEATDIIEQGLGIRQAKTNE